MSPYRSWRSSGSPLGFPNVHLLLLQYNLLASMPDFFDEGRPHDGLSYEEYRSNWKRQLDESPPEDADASERRMHYYLQYNWDRQAHVHEAYSPSEELRSVIRVIEDSQLWMVLTEPWCGDSAFLLPVIAEAASLSEEVTLQILPRDENLDIMDQYLTGGSRSIPKLVTFSEAGKELFTWGPRPDEAAQKYQSLKQQYDDKNEIIAELLDYYEDGGWREAEEELVAAFRSVVGSRNVSEEEVQ